MQQRETLKVVLAYVGVFLAVLFWVSSSVAVQLMDRDVPDFEMNFLRFGVGIILFGAGIVIKREPLTTSDEEKPYLFICGVLNFLFALAYYCAMSFMPLSHVSGVVQGFQVVCVVVIARIMDSEPISRHLLPIGGCITGMLLIIQPWDGFSQGFIPKFLQGNISSMTNLTLSGVTPTSPTYMLGSVVLGYTFSICAAACLGLNLYISYSKLKNVTSIKQCMAAACVSSPLSLIFSVYAEDFVLVTDTRTLLLLAVHSVCVALANILIIDCCKTIGPTQLSLFINFETIIYLIPQYTIMSTSLHGRMNAVEVVGCVLTVAAISVGVMMSQNGSLEEVS